jgi:hypothetical protein
MDEASLCQERIHHEAMKKSGFYLLGKPCEMRIS